MVKITGDQKHRQRLQRMGGEEARRSVYRALYTAGQIIEIEAELSITEGSISGPGHIPSLPGEPPNADTRLLDTSIETTGFPGAMRVEVSSNAPYAADLEYGNSRIEERPYMRPAVLKKRDEVARLVGNAVVRIARR